MSGGIRPGGPNAQLQASFASGAMSKAMSDVDDMSDDDMNDVEDQPTANVPVVSSVACHLAGQQAQSQRLPAIYSTRSMPWTPPAFAPMQPGMGMVHMDFGQQIQPNHLAYGHQDKPNLATPMGGYQGLGPSPEMPLPSTAPSPGMASALGGGPGNFPSDQPRTCSSNSPFQAYDAHSTGKSSLQLEESSKERRRLQSQDRRQRVMCDIDLCDEPTSELPEAKPQKKTRGKGQGPKKWDSEAEGNRNRVRKSRDLQGLGGGWFCPAASAAGYRRSPSPSRSPSRGVMRSINKMK